MKTREKKSEIFAKKQGKMDLLTNCVAVTGVKQLTIFVVPAVFGWTCVGARQWTLIGKGHIILIRVQMIRYTIAVANLRNCLPVDLDHQKWIDQ